MRLRGWRRLGLSALLGLLIGLGQAPINFPYAALGAVPLLLVLLRRACCRKAGFAIGWGAGAGYFGLSMIWIVEPFLVDAPRYGWMAPFALLLMAGGLAGFWGLGFALAQRWMRGNGWDALVLAGCWTGVEVLRSVIFTGFPWALQVYGWVDTPVIQGAALIGVHGLGFVLVLALALLADRRGWPVAVLLILAMVGYGSWRLTAPVAMRDYTVRLVQPNAEQRLKWNPDYIEGFYTAQLDLSAAGHDRPDVVIWPEAAIAYLPEIHPLIRLQIAEFAKAPVILGARRFPNGKAFNSLFLLNENGQIDGVYDKYHLVPFGEYMPFQALARQWGLTGLADEMGRGMDFGSGPKLLGNDTVPPFLPMICYEAIFPQGLFVEPRPEWLVQITNDAWFGGWSGPYQHLAQTRVRAIEQGLPLARAANTGVSAMIDPYGRITAQIPLGQRGYVDAPLPVPLAPTVLAKTGQWPGLVVMALLLGLGIWRNRNT